MDYAKDFTDSDGLPREDQTVWVYGGGIRVRPVNWLDVNVAYRNNLLKPLHGDKFVNNALWTAGVSFRFGGTPGKPKSTVYGSTATSGNWLLLPVRLHLATWPRSRSR